MKFFIILFFFSLFYTNAQTDSIFINDFNDALKLSADFYTSPLHYDSKDWITFSSVVGLTAVATLADKEIKNFSQKNQTNFQNNIFNIDNYFRLDYAVGSMVLLYGYGLIAEDDNTRNLAVKLTEATIFAGSLTLVSKTLLGRARPYMQTNQYYTNPGSFNNDYNSFPSGHTTLAFAYSTVMANEIDNIFWKVGWYSAASLVGYARIYHNQHWFSDVLMGAAIGYFSGEFVSNHNSSKKEETQIKLFPAPNGFAVQIIF